MTTGRLVKRVAIGSAVLVLLAAGLGWFLLSSDWAARTVIAFALGKSKAGVTIEHVAGRLRGPLVLTGVRYRSGSVSALVDSVYLEWRPAGLLHHRLELTELAVTGLHVTLPDSVPKDTAGSAAARRERPRPPVEIVMGEAVIRGIEVDAVNNVDLSAGFLRLEGSLDDYRFTMSGSNLIRKLPELPALAVRVTGSGDLVGIRIDRFETQALAGEVWGRGKVRWWPTVGWDLAVAADRIEPGRMMPDSSRVAGWLTVAATTNGTVEPTGPAGQLTVDSARGVLANRAVRGRAQLRFAGTRYDLDSLDALWGPLRARAKGAIGDPVAVTYRVDVADLARALPNATGSVSMAGRATGPRADVVVRGTVDGRRVGYQSAMIDRLSGHALVELSATGRNDLDLLGLGGKLGTRDLGRVALSLKGVRQKHRLTIDAAAPGDTLTFGAAGGLRGTSWSGAIDSMHLASAQAGRWNLERPAPIAAAPSRARLDTLCLAADSTGGRACAAGEWHGGTVWNAFAEVSAVPLTRVAAGRLEGFAGGGAAFRGTLGVRADARSTESRLDATIRATSDTIAFTYREKGDSIDRRLSLDSAVVSVKADRSGMNASLGLRVLDAGKKEVAVLAGQGTIPRYRVGQPFKGLALRASIDGKVDSLSFARPLFPAVDSLRGRLVLTLRAAGRVDAPEVDGSVVVDRMIVGLDGRNVVMGSIGLTATGSAAANHALSGTVRVTPHDLVYGYRRLGHWRQVVADTGSLTVTVGPSGVRGRFGLAIANPDSTAIGSILADLSLPQYTRWDRPIGAEPMTFHLKAELPHLGVFEPWFPAIDDLRGRLALEASGQGKVGTPTVDATLAVDSLGGRFSFGTELSGGLTGSLKVAVAPDSTVKGTLSLLPKDLALDYTEGTRPTVVRFDSTSLTVDAGPTGVHGRLAMNLADSTTVLAALRGTLALPRYTRVGRPLQPEPIQGTLTGRIDDLGFIKAFTPQVDSAVGRATLDAKLDGTLGESHLTGGFKLEHAAARLPGLGILLDSIALTATGDQSGAVAVDGRLHSGRGTLTIKGATPVQPTTAKPGRIQVEGTNFEAVHNAQVYAVVTPKLTVRLAGDTVGVFGDVAVPVARVTLAEIPEFAIPPSDDVILVDSIAPRRPPRPLAARVRLTLGDSVTFRGFNFNAQFGGSLVASQRPGRLATATGTLTIVEGHYKAYGQDLSIEDGQITYVGGAVDNPGLSIRASRTATDSTVAGIQLSGTLKQPVVTLFSTPGMSESQILSYIVRGQPLAEGGGASGNLVDKALSSLGLRGGNLLAGAIGDQIGLDNARIEAEGDLRRAAFVAGHYLSPNLYVAYGIGLFDPVSTLRLRYVLSRRFTLQVETGRETSADILIKSESGRTPPKPE